MMQIKNIKLEASNWQANHYKDGALDGREGGFSQLFDMAFSELNPRLNLAGGYERSAAGRELKKVPADRGDYKQDYQDVNWREELTPEPEVKEQSPAERREVRNEPNGNNDKDEAVKLQEISDDGRGGKNVQPAAEENAGSTEPEKDVMLKQLVEQAHARTVRNQLNGGEGTGRKPMNAQAAMVKLGMESQKGSGMGQQQMEVEIGGKNTVKNAVSVGDAQDEQVLNMLGKVQKNSDTKTDVQVSHAEEVTGNTTANRSESQSESEQVKIILRESFAEKLQNDSLSSKEEQGKQNVLLKGDSDVMEEGTRQKQNHERQQLVEISAQMKKYAAEGTVETASEKDATLKFNSETGKRGNLEKQVELKIAATPGETPGRAGRKEGISEWYSVAKPDMTRMQENVDRVVKAARSAVSRGSAQIQIRLSPPELGNLRIDIRQNASGMRLQLQATTVEAQQMLQRNSHELRATLEAAGLHNTQIEVKLRLDLNNDSPQGQSQESDASWQEGNHEGDGNWQESRDESLFSPGNQEQGGSDIVSEVQAEEEAEKIEVLSSEPTAEGWGELTFGRVDLRI